MDLKDIQNLIKFVAKSGASEVKLEMGDIKITVKTGTPESRGEITYVQQHPSSVAQNIQVPAQMQNQTVAQPEQETVNGGTENSKYVTIKSPIIGTFYRKSAPDKPVFVEVGDTISSGDVLCVIEAMKLFNEIESDISGKIIKVLVDDSSPVEYDQPLFLVDPS